MAANASAATQPARISLSLPAITTEMLNDKDTLQDYDIEGAPETEPETASIIHYDFKPQQHDNPLLLATEQQ